MLYEFSRSESLLGKEAMEILRRSKVAVFGVGGVGSYAAEALARTGVGSILLVDNDKVSITNINRQIIALHSTIGRYKTEVMLERIKDINPGADVEIRTCFFGTENSHEFIFSDYDYVVDAIDSVKSKIEIIEKAVECETEIISSMGTGNKLDPLKLEITDIYKTEMCPLARVMRRELRKRNIKKLKVLDSKEEPILPKIEIGETKGNYPAPASVAFVPSVAGMLIAKEVISDLIRLRCK